SLEFVVRTLRDIDREAPAVVTIGGSAGEAHAGAAATLPSGRLTHEQSLNAVHGSSQQFRRHPIARIRTASAARRSGVWGGPDAARPADRHDHSATPLGSHRRI